MSAAAELLKPRQGAINGVVPLGQRHIIPNRRFSNFGLVVSPEAQAVLDRMSNLTPQETAAVVRFVNAMAAGLLWGLVDDCWAPPLTDPQDALTGFVTNPFGWLTNIGGVHVPGEGLQFGAGANGIISSTGVLAWPTIPQGVLFYNTDEGSSDTANVDYAGFTSAGVEIYLRRRSDGAGFDTNAVWAQAGVTPRPLTVGPFTDDVCGWWLEALSVGTLHPGGIIESSSRVAAVPPLNEQFSFHGRNDAGTIQNSGQAMERFWLVLKSSTPSEVALIRPLILQFLTDLGAI